MFKKMDSLKQLKIFGLQTPAVYWACFAGCLREWMTTQSGAVPSSRALEAEFSNVLPTDPAEAFQRLNQIPNDHPLQSVFSSLACQAQSTLELWHTSADWMLKTQIDAYPARSLFRGKVTIGPHVRIVWKTHCIDLLNSCTSGVPVLPQQSELPEKRFRKNFENDGPPANVRGIARETPGFQHYRSFQAKNGPRTILTVEMSDFVPSLGLKMNPEGIGEATSALISGRFNPHGRKPSSRSNPEGDER